MEKQQLMFYKVVYLTDLTKICIDSAAISGNIISSVLYLGGLVLLPESTDFVIALLPLKLQ